MSVFALLTVVVGLGPVLAPLLGSAIQLVGSWRTIFALLAVIGALLVVATAMWIPETLPPGHRVSGGVLAGASASYGRLLSDGRTWLVITTGAVGFGALFAYITGSPFAFQEVHGLSPSEFAVVFAVDGLCLMACARWVRFSRALHQIACGAAFLVAGSALLVVAAGTDGLAAARRLCGHRSVVGCDRPSVTALALMRHPERAGAAAALLGALQFRGGRGDGLAGGA
ncbi:MFS transporter [Gordonia sp. NPDC003504]